LTHLGRVRGVPREELRRRIRELADLFQLHAAGPITHFSKGMAQKVNLMQAMLVRPDVLILDEPLSGLDADAQAELARLLPKLGQEGTAVVLTGHEPGFAEGWADRIAVIRDGKLEEQRARAAGPADESDPSAWICDQWGLG
jgi:ABC-type multidrug transport system ATPase subunit